MEYEKTIPNAGKFTHNDLFPFRIRIFKIDSSLYNQSCVSALRAILLHIFFIFFFSILIYIHYYLVLVSDIEHSGETIIYITKYYLWYSRYSTGTIHSCSSITDCFLCCTSHPQDCNVTTNVYISVFSPFSSSPITPLTSGNHQSVL